MDTATGMPRGTETVEMTAVKMAARRVVPMAS